MGVCGIIYVSLGILEKVKNKKFENHWFKETYTIKIIIWSNWYMLRFKDVTVAVALCDMWHMILYHWVFDTDDSHASNNHWRHIRHLLRLTKYTTINYGLSHSTWLVWLTVWYHYFKTKESHFSQLIDLLQSNMIILLMKVRYWNLRRRCSYATLGYSNLDLN